MIQPLSDRVVVRLDEPETVSAGGLYLPHPETPLTGQVLAVGPGAKCTDCGYGRSMTLRVGDAVVLAPNTPVCEVTIDGQAVIVLRETDVLACIGEQA